MGQWFSPSLRQRLASHLTADPRVFALKKIPVYSHPPYSADLAPSVFWLFPNGIKRIMFSQHFGHSEGQDGSSEGPVKRNLPEMYPIMESMLG